MEELQELLVDGLRDIYDAEKQLVKSASETHEGVIEQRTERIVQRAPGSQPRIRSLALEQCLELLGEKVKSKPCKAMKGLVEEAQEHLQEHEKGELLIRCWSAAAQKVEHYEIAAYGTARAIAKSLGNKEAMNLFRKRFAKKKARTSSSPGIAVRLQKGDGAREARTGGRQSRSSGYEQPRQPSAAAVESLASQQTEQSASSEPPVARSDGRTAVASGRWQPRVLTDHEEIRQWAEERGAHPVLRSRHRQQGRPRRASARFPGLHRRGQTGGDLVGRVLRQVR